MVCGLVCGLVCPIFLKLLKPWHPILIILWSAGRRGSGCILAYFGLRFCSKPQRLYPKPQGWTGIHCIQKAVFALPESCLCGAWCEAGHECIRSFNPTGAIEICLKLWQLHCGESLFWRCLVLVLQERGARWSRWIWSWVGTWCLQCHVATSGWWPFKSGHKKTHELRPAGKTIAKLGQKLWCFQGQKICGGR